MIEVTFRGVRGSTPVAHSKYGGHTSCIEIMAGSTQIICDAGSGLVDVDIEDKHDIHLLLSHAHMDHIMGLPYFKPMWNKNYTTHMHGATFSPYGGIEGLMHKTWAPPLFPVPFKAWSGNFHFHDHEIGSSWHINDVNVSCHGLNHPNGAAGYRIEYNNQSVAYITDHEHTNDEQALADFVRGVDLLIYDAMFDERIWEPYKGWGHSTWQAAVRLKEAAGVTKLALFHHNPQYDDNKLDAISKELPENTFFAIQGKTWRSK